jgi:hypothetical protein
MTEARFAVCVRNDGCSAALKLHRLYRAYPDEADRAFSMLCVEDGHGGAYLYPREFFRPVHPPALAADGVGLPADAELRFVVPLREDDAEVDLRGDRLYPVLPDDSAAASGRIRVLADSGADALYPETLFRPIDVPADLQEELLRAA